MAETSYPWQTGSGTAVTEALWQDMARRFEASGVIGASTRDATDTSLLPTIPGGGGGPTFGLTAGDAWVAGVQYNNSAALTKTGTNNGSSDPRIDRLVLKLDKVAKTVTASILPGTASSTPVPPSTTGDSNTAYLKIGRATVAGGGTVYTNLVDERTFTAVRHYAGPSAGSGLSIQAGDTWYQTDKKQLLVYDGAALRGTRTIKYAGIPIGTPTLPPDGRYNMVAGDIATYASVTIPDPGYPYQVTCSAHIAMGGMSAGFVTSYVRLDDLTSGTILAQDSSTREGAGLDTVIRMPGSKPHSLTGAHTIWFNVVPSAAATGGYFLWSSPTNWLSVEVTPDWG